MKIYINKIILSIVILYIILMININIALAYCVKSDGAECHELLTDKAIELIKSKENNGDLDYQDIRYEIRYGSYEEDQPATQVAYHFLNPLTGEGIPFFLNAEKRSIDASRSENWQNAINTYNYSIDSKKTAYRYLGHIVHLVQDMSVPAHTHIDFHIPPSYDDYETYVKDHTDLISNLPVDTLSIRNWNNRQSYFYELAKLSYYRNRYPADLSDTNDPQGDLLKLYPYPAFLKFNSFFSYWEIKDVGKKWESDSLGFQDTWWETDMPAWYYIENTNPDTPSPPVKEKSKWDPNNPALDEYNYDNINGFSIARIYADQLLPLAVDYSAGLIQFYYNIVNHPPYVKRVKVTQIMGDTERKLYDKNWDMAHDHDYRTLVDNLDNPESDRDAIAGEGVLKFEIEFSESVKNNDGNNVAVKFGEQNVIGTISDNNWWKGELNLAGLVDTSLEGEQKIKITAEDKDEHYDNVGGKLDPDPGTPARRIVPEGQTDEYEWTGYDNNGADDENHKIKLVYLPIVEGTSPYNNGMDVVFKRVNFSKEMNKASVVASIGMDIPLINKCNSTNPPIFYCILYDQETINYPFPNHYLYN
jgi:hypothetical protein